MERIDNPYIKLIAMAVDGVNKITGTSTVSANRSFAKKVEMVAAHIAWLYACFQLALRRGYPKHLKKRLQWQLSEFRPGPQSLISSLKWSSN